MMKLKTDDESLMRCLKRAELILDLRGPRRWIGIADASKLFIQSMVETHPEVREGLAGIMTDCEPDEADLINVAVVMMFAEQFSEDGRVGPLAKCVLEQLDKAAKCGPD